MAASLDGDGVSRLRVRIAILAALLTAANLAAWGVAFALFHGYPVLIGTALLAWGLGLRHAVDADHIAAIDNVTRKLMQEGRRPIAVGLYFALGHSTIVVLASAAIALTATSFRGELAAFRAIGGVAGTTVSAGFLLLIACLNLATLMPLVRAWRGTRPVEQDLDRLLAGRGLLARVLRPLSRLIRASWQMYPLGFLFGLGFDTASEIGLLGISATQAADGLPLWSIMLFAALFAAGMSLVDTLDGILMLGAYGWAFRNPARKLGYNIAVTALSALVALVIGGIEVLGLIGGKFDLRGAFWNGVDHVNENLGAAGWCIVALFAASWLVSLAVHRYRGGRRLEAEG